jgi:outer membrane protein
MRRFLIISLVAAIARAQSPQAIAPERKGAPILRTYEAPVIPPIRQRNSARIRSLIRAGKLYLTLPDAITLAIENNLDLEVNRYDPVMAQATLERQLAGGPIRGVPSGSQQIASVDNGLGAAGSIQASGLSNSGNGSNSGGNANTTVQQVGQITPNLDPTLQSTTSFSHQTLPFANLVGVGTYSLVQEKHTYSTIVTQGFLTGGSFQVTDYEQYLNENSPSDVNNPAVGPYIAVYLKQQLLQGFGIKLNDRFIRIARLNIQGARETFRSQVIDLVTSVINQYWDVASAQDELKDRQHALENAQKFLSDTQYQIQMGVLAKVELPRAESEVEGRRQDLLIAQTTVRQQEIRLKDALSRQDDPLLESAEIVPLDHIDVPKTDDLPTLRQMVATAMQKRPDVAVSKIRDKTQDLNALGTTNPLLPSLSITLQAQNRGLAGTYQPSSGAPNDPYFSGGYGNALGQIFRRDFPTEYVSLNFSAPLGNRGAQADYGIDQLQLRQSAVSGLRDSNAIVVAISNQATGLRQARARYATAVDARVLEEQLLKSEQDKFKFGKSTISNVIATQRALVNAQTAEIDAQSAYAHARVLLDQVLGTTLETNRVSLDEALGGSVKQTSSLPPGP